LSKNLSEISGLNERAQIEQQISAQTTDSARTYNSAMIMLNALIDNPHNKLEFSSEKSEYLLPPNKISPELIEMNTDKAIPNDAAFYLVNNKPRFLDYSM
jgi:hypothetical protein